MHVNIRSLPKNFDALQQFILNLDTKPHVILITETWLDNSLSSSYALDCYCLITSSQPEIRGKGTAMYINSSLAYSRRSDLESNIHQYQSVFIEIKTSSNRNIILGSAYRSPSFPVIQFVDYLEQTLEKINCEHKLCLLGGDMNVDILKHDVDDICSSFVTSLASLGFFPCISLPTRITSHSATLIDNFFCNDPSFVKSPAVLVHDISDHLPITVSVDTMVDIQQKTFANHKSFDYRKIENLKQSLSTRLIYFYQITDAETACSVLIETLQKGIAENSIKSVNRRSVPIQPWISFGLLRCINRKNSLHKKFVHSPTDLNHETFKN